ncbi:MAG: helix-turn-helix domain-containing protein [Treponema sp.]|nr:helix-turn-helix domain-containing protein [Treponema sp.]
MVQSSIIYRRDLEPLHQRAVEIARYYERAADCISAVMGADYHTIELSTPTESAIFCSFCSQYRGKSAGALAHCPCTPLHRIAARKARELGGSYVYTCHAGFLFWTSPFFAGERFAGAFISGAIPDREQQEILDKLFAINKGTVSRDEIARQITQIPVKTGEEVQALAQMLLLCAQNISTSDTFYSGQDYGVIGSLSNSESADLQDKERSLLANLRRGDYAEAKKTISEILKHFDALCEGNFELFKYRVMELVVLLSRSGADSQNADEITGANSRFLRKINDSKTAKEITENLFLIIEQMAGKIFSFRGIRHSSALRKAERFIWENYSKKYSLKEAARSSGLSASYFSTVFRNEMGENFSSYLNRLRIEKASLMLLETESPIKNIALACGFKDQSWFSKTFKSFTGISPCKYRETGGVFPQGLNMNAEEKNNFEEEKK